MNRLKEKYTQDIVPSLVQKFDYSSVMQTPKVEKKSLLIWVLVMQYLMLRI